MRNRSILIQFLLNEREAAKLNAAVKKSGLTRAGYMRMLIDGIIPVEQPPPDYHAMMRELHAIGNNLNQIAKKAHNVGGIDVQRYDEAVEELSKAVVRISKEVKRGRRI